MEDANGHREHGILKTSILAPASRKPIGGGGNLLRKDGQSCPVPEVIILESAMVAGGEN